MAADGWPPTSWQGGLVCMLHVSKDMDEEILYAPSPSSWSGSRSGSWSRWSSWSGCSSTLSRCYCPLATTALRSKSPTLRTWKRERRQFWEVSNIENTLENLQIFQTLLHWWSSLILRCLHVGKDMDDMKKYYMHCILCINSWGYWTPIYLNPNSNPKKLTFWHEKIKCLE